MMIKQILFMAAILSVCCFSCTKKNGIRHDAKSNDSTGHAVKDQSTSMRTPPRNADSALPQADEAADDRTDADPDSVIYSIRPKDTASAKYRRFDNANSYLKWTSAQAVTATGIRFLRCEKIFDEMVVEEPEKESADEEDILGSGYKVGTMISGKYAGADLVVAGFSSGLACKSESGECERPLIARFVKRNSELIFLKNISSAAPFKAPSRDLVARFLKIGFSLSVDGDYSVPCLEIPDSVKGPRPRQGLKVDREEIADVTPQYDSLFHDATFGNVYCFTGNGSRDSFYIFRPDGSSLTLRYIPDFQVDEIQWKKPPTHFPRGGYCFRPHAYYMDIENPFDEVVSENRVSKSGLVALGITPLGEPVYGINDDKDSLLRDFYSRYVKYYRDYAENGSRTERDSGIRGDMKDYDEFLASTPVFFWRDPFGRFIRFNNTDFLRIYLAEPIIYLYPSSKQLVRVSVTPVSKAIEKSIPPYGTGWEVVADPSGKLLNKPDRKTHPYLFWEGWGPILPMQKSGYVVARNEINGFLREKLRILGLNDVETADFIKAWFPELSEKPYVFITFIERRIIDSLAVLHVSPKPDAVIRILMDFRPLEKPLSAMPPELSIPPARQGMVVVEWGGIKR